MHRILFKDAEVQAALGQLEAQLENTAPVMADIAELLLASTKARFLQGVSPEGAPWAPKSLNTMEAYRNRSGSGVNSRVDPRPLHGPSGALASTISKESGLGFASVGSPMIYARVMQEGAAQGAFGKTRRGGPIPWGRIPARPYLGISDGDRANILAIVTEWLGEAVED